MRWPAVRRAASAVAGLLLLVACAKGGADVSVSRATVGTEAPTTTTTNPYAVPAVIDAAYVNRVLAGLDAATGDIIRSVVVAHAITPDVIERLKAVYSDPNLLQFRIDSLQTDLRSRISTYRTDPGNPKTTVSRLITVAPACIYAQVSRDFSQVAVSPDARLATQWVALRRNSGSATASQFNQTGWSLAYDGFEKDLTPPKVDPCQPA